MNRLKRESIRATHETSGDAINLAQLWTLGQYRKSLGLNHQQWSNLLKPYGIRTAHDLQQQDARAVITLLSAATRMRALTEKAFNEHRISNSTCERRRLTSFPLARESNTASTIRGSEERLPRSLALP